ncbi:MAG: hypothetical protein LAO22_10280 [Acidobacteriia bacterium]|nr:hypothetical protein [Terriglobia bacterium]
MRRPWTALLEDKAEAQPAVDGNRGGFMAIAGNSYCGGGESCWNAVLRADETGGMRRVHLRGRENVLKRVLIHVGAFDLSLVMRQLLGKGNRAVCRPLGGEFADGVASGSRFPSAQNRKAHWARSPCRVHRIFSLPSRQNEQTTFTTGCKRIAILVAQNLHV